ncbi:MAG: polysaccharide deacetylase family protein [candidate division Zixibacteria bacterium]|nr:polysaccharide deacetylase family protein [candidate division Zixibacteria bacterium]
MLRLLGLTGLYLCGWYMFWRFTDRRPAGNILAFHDINDKLDLSITRNSVKGFSEIMEYLAATGFRGTSLADQATETDIALTFDDGWSGIYESAFPILRKHGFTATVFVISDYVGKTSTWDYKRESHMTWSQIRELANNGIEIGSHGANHIDIRNLDNKSLEYEVSGSKETIENKLGKPVNCFSYPFGRYDNRAIEAVKKAGYEKAYALSTDGGAYAIARRGVYLYDTPYSINRKLMKQSGLEQCKDYINNSLAGGTITLRKLFPKKAGGKA